MTQAPSPLEACNLAGILVIATAWEEFRSVNLEEVRDLMAGRLILDPLGVLDGRYCSDLGFKYYRLGRQPFTPDPQY